MPIVEVHLLEGYPAEAKARLGRAVTEAVRLVVPAAPEAVTVMLRDMAATDYFRGGEARSPAPPAPDPLAGVQDSLAAREAREIDRARAHLGEGFAMVFPGTAPMTTLEELIAWARPRYRFVKKTYDAWEVFGQDGRAVVYARGTLRGEWPDGTAFSGIRFIDRFEVVAGRIVRQDVWNDIAETKAQGA